jgi:Amidohydrolase family
VRAGVDTIEHGAWLDDETVAEMARRGTWYVPTFAIYRWHAERGSALRQARARELIAPHRESFSRACAAGVRIALGTDSGAYGHGETAVELGHMVEAGLSPPDAIVAGTARAAECLGVDGETGMLAAGKAADLLVLDRDPLRDITVASDATARALVIRAGGPSGAHAASRGSARLPCPEWPAIAPTTRWTSSGGGGLRLVTGAGSLRARARVDAPAGGMSWTLPEAPADPEDRVRHHRRGGPDGCPLAGMARRVPSTTGSSDERMVYAGCRTYRVREATVHFRTTGPSVFLRKQREQNPGVGRVEVVFLQPADRDQHNLCHFRRTGFDAPTTESLAQRSKSLFGKTPVVEVEAVGPRFLRNIRDRIDLRQSDNFDLNPDFLEHLAPEGRLDDVVA